MILSKPNSLILVIFGASGDLSKRKLIPSLYQLFKQGKLPERFSILGLGRTPFTDETFLPHLDENLQRFLAEGEYDKELASKFLASVHYMSMDPQKEEEYTRLKACLEELDKGINNPKNYIFYLSTPPALYSLIPKHLKSVGLNTEDTLVEGTCKCRRQTAIRRIIVEKPFGTDLASALELTDIYKDSFKEEQIYRIDHFLGKETVQDIMALRFANSIFEPIWNRNYIDRVEVTAVENMTIEGRGGFYDGTGAMRDMVQNHLAQLVALIAMEAPIKFDGNHFRNEVLRVYESFRPMSNDDIRKNVIRGQYTQSETTKGYREEDKVDPKSRTETFLAMKLNIDNWRWQGVPFYIRTGKAMPTKVSEIVIHFKPTPHRMFSDKPNTPNKLIIRISPNEGIVLKFAAKVPGSGFDLKEVAMNFSYDQLGGLASGDAYSRLLEDSMIGDSTLFTRSDAVEKSWEFFDPILKLWEEDPSFPLYGYPAGTWGPKQSELIFDKTEHSWTNPCKNLTNTDIYCEL